MNESTSHWKCWMIRWNSASHSTASSLHHFVVGFLFQKWRLNQKKREASGLQAMAMVVLLTTDRPTATTATLAAMVAMQEATTTEATSAMTRPILILQSWLSSRASDPVFNFRGICRTRIIWKRGFYAGHFFTTNESLTKNIKHQKLDQTFIYTFRLKLDEWSANYVVS